MFENIAPPETEAIAKTVRLNRNVDTEYEIVNIRGARLGKISAKSAQQAAEALKYGNMVKSSGVYYLRSRATGKMQSVRVVK